MKTSDTLLDKIKRFRTWLLNLVTVYIFAPEVIALLLGYDWTGIVPDRFMPIVTLVVAILNIMMRWRPASLGKDHGRE